MVKSRIGYIDAARGLAIFTVVYSHLVLFSHLNHETSAVLDFLRTYFLTAFFFISGLVANINSNKRENREYGKMIYNKILQLLIPTIIVGLFFSLTHNIAIKTFIFNSAKFGYWFTIVLFEFFLLYYIIRILFNWDRSKNVAVWVLVFISFLIYISFKFYHFSESLSGVLCWSGFSYYLPYFAVGTLVASYRDRISTLLGYRGGIVVTLIFLILSYSYIPKVSVPVPLIIRNFLTVFIVIYLLKKVYEHSFNNRLISGIKDWMVKFGKYTLEIYFIHYFLLFPIPIFLANYFASVPKNMSLSLIEFIIIGSFTVLICFCSIVISRLLSFIPFAGKFLFGKIK